MAGNRTPAVSAVERLATVVDESALVSETIFVSAGRRGLELPLAPDDLVALTRARTAAVASRR